MSNFIDISIVLNKTSKAAESLGLDLWHNSKYLFVLLFRIMSLYLISFAQIFPFRVIPEAILNLEFRSNIPSF